MTLKSLTRSEDGFTLVELLVATLMSGIVFAVTLSALGAFSNASQSLTNRNDSQNQARLADAQIVSQLRNASDSSSAASFVERATPYDLVFQTTSVAGGSSMLVRYCAPADPAPGSAATEELYTQSQSPAPSTIPWSSTACPDPNYPSSVLVAGVTNRYQGQTRSIFTYNGTTAPSNLSMIKTIGINLFVNTKPTDPNNEYALQTSALLQNAQGSPVAAFTTSQGASGSVFLNGGASYSPSDVPLSYAWSCKTSGGTTLSCPSTSSSFTWSPGAGTYTVSLTVTDQSGLQSTPYASTVIVR